MKSKHGDLIQLWQKRFTKVAFRDNCYWSDWVDNAIEIESVLWYAMELNRTEQRERKNNHE